MRYNENVQNEIHTLSERDMTTKKVTISDDHDDSGAEKDKGVMRNDDNDDQPEDKPRTEIMTKSSGMMNRVSNGFQSNISNNRKGRRKYSAKKRVEGEKSMRDIREFMVSRNLAKNVTHIRNEVGPCGEEAEDQMVS